MIVDLYQTDKEAEGEYGSQTVNTQAGGQHRIVQESVHSQTVCNQTGNRHSRQTDSELGVDVPDTKRERNIDIDKESATQGHIDHKKYRDSRTLCSTDNGNKFKYIFV